MKRKTTSGSPARLGATLTGDGTNFALYSSGASGVELCLFDAEGHEQRFDVTECTHNIWHVHVAGITAGQRYGYRVHGPWAPDRGARFNPSKLLIDPYARQIDGPLVVQAAHFDFSAGEDGELLRSTIDNADFQAKSVVTAPPVAASSQGPAIAMSETIIYEAHVKGFTRLLNDIPEAQRGTYAGLGHKVCIDHIRSIGVTSVELMPVQAFVDEQFLTDRKLTNYWGYNTIGFFMPTTRYAQIDPAGEFRALVNALHDANLEVILDVVYNHTAEGGRLGPTFSFRGIDNTAYYRLGESGGDYVNDTGCGNTLNTDHPATLRLVMDSLRFWVAEMGVDGFRFDLATSLGRDASGYSPNAALFKAIHQDPVLSHTKLIAEPWDIGPGGYQLGGFPVGWSEWNDRYRDTVRRFWRGDDGILPDLARVVHGSSDLFEVSGRTPQAGINFVTSHDGFTLADLVTYETKHNEANGEDNRDGHDANYSINCGVEGPTDDPAINHQRTRRVRNLLATLFVSQGVPMLLAGDELGRTQRGNNNSYCQDNATSWVDWQNIDSDLLAFVQRLAELRKQYPELRLKKFIHGRVHEHYEGLDEIDWYHPGGKQMSASDWDDPATLAVGLMIHGAMVLDEPGAQLVYILFNAGDEPLNATLPHVPEPGAWRCELGTAGHHDPSTGTTPGVEFELEEHSMVVFVFNGAAS